MWPGPEGDWARTYSEANTDYKRLLEEYAAEVKRRGATPVIVSPMAKWDLADGKSVNKLGDCLVTHDERIRASRVHAIW